MSEIALPNPAVHAERRSHAVRHGHARTRTFAPAHSLADFAALALLLAGAGFVFFWNLTASGYANEFYSAAAQAASKSWSAFLWGSLDAGGAITVDKPPASIWIMALSVRLFGLSSFAILAPQALMGIACTLLLYATTRRYWGNAAGLAAGAIFIATPVAALMFRFNNPDALLILLQLAAAALVLRALESPATRAGNRRRTLLICLAGLLCGLGFLTKQFQVLLVVPGFALALFAFSPTKVGRRLLDGLAAIASIAVGAGWWVLLTVIVPSGSRPYIGGSQTDSFIELTFGYNGLGRLTGDETGSVVPGAASSSAQGGMWGETGIARLFTSDFGDQITWLALLAFTGIVVGVVCARTLRKRSGGLLAAQGDAANTAAFSLDAEALCDLARLRMATIAVFGAWLVVTWLTFSFMAGIFHAYYTVALAPAIAFLAAACVRGLWELRGRTWTRGAAALLIAFSSAWSFALVWRSGSYRWLGIAIAALGIISALMLAASSYLAEADARALPAAQGEAYASSRPHRIVQRVALVLGAAALMAGPVLWTACTITSAHTGSLVTAGPSGQGGMGGGAGAGGGGLTGSSSNSEVASLLSQNASGYRWAAATCGSQNAATYQLATELPVMAIGGFNGSDPAPTLKQFKTYVKQGLVRYYIASGGMGGSQMGGSDAASQIEEWVSQNFTATTVGGVTIYDLQS